MMILSSWENPGLDMISQNDLCLTEVIFNTTKEDYTAAKG